MNDLTPHRLETSFLQPGTPMFSDVMRLVAASPDLSAQRKRDILSGLRRVARALNRTPEHIPADAIWLQPRLKSVAPASISLSPKSWSNALSDMRAGLVLFGVVDRRISRLADLSPAWKALWQIVLKSGDPTLPRSLSRFVYFLDRLGIAPGDVSLAEGDAYREALQLNELSRSPDIAYRTAINAWNLAVLRIPEWPRQTFVLPSRSRRIALGLEAFPAAFQSDLARYLESLAHPDPLDPEALAAPLRPATLGQYRTMILRFASILVRADVPITSIDGLAALVNPEVTGRGLRWMLDRNKGQTTPGTSDMVNLLKGIAKRYVRVDDESQKKLDHWDSRLAGPAQSGMTPKNSDRLRPLDDTATLVRLLRLPQQLFDRTKGQQGKQGRSPVLRREEAIAIAILLHCPIRCKNLTWIHLERNLHRPGHGRVFLVFEPNEVKNNRRIEFELPPSVVEMVDAHLATRSPLLCPAATPWLFPRRDGSGPLNLIHFAGRVQKRILVETGLVINIHLFRHLAAKISLEAYPGQYESVRRLLGHANASQTLNFYSGFEAGSAALRFSELIQSKQRL